MIDRVAETTSVEVSKPALKSPEPITGTGRLRRKVQETRYFQSLTDQGMNFTIPGELINVAQIPELSGEVQDSLTQLPIETDGVRSFVISEIGKELRSGGEVAIEEIDGDNIKVHNLTDRELGDLGIVDSASRTARGSLVVARPFSAPQTPAEARSPRVIVLRQKDAADETLAVYLGITPDAVDRLREQRKLDDAEIVTRDPDARFSQTSSIISTTDMGMVGPTLSTRRWLQANPDSIPYNFYKKIRAELDERVKDGKELKQWNKLQNPTYFEPISTEALQEAIVGEYGGGRVSKKVLKYFMQYSNVMDIRNRAISLNEEGGDVDMYLGFNNLVRADVTGIDSPDKVVAVYNKIHQIADKNGS